MHIAFLILITISLLTILIQDIKHRAVTWWLFPVLFCLSYFYQFWTMNFFLSNLVFIFIQLICLYLYFSSKQKKFIPIQSLPLGLGDILMFFVLALWFSPINFMLFFVGSLLLTILATIVLQRTKKTIPLAGVHAFMLLFMVFMKETISPRIFTDSWLSL